MTASRWLAVSMVGVSLLLAACGGAHGDTDETDAPAAARSAPDRAQDNGDAEDVTPTGKVITVQLISDEQGNRFEPAHVKAHRGDVLRFTLTSGVHNIDFYPDSNPRKRGLPAASEMLQLPGQTLDVPVTFAPGHYQFQCDPHAPLGMVGRLEVEQDSPDR